MSNEFRNDIINIKSEKKKKEIKDLKVRQTGAFEIAVEVRQMLTSYPRYTLGYPLQQH